MKSKWPGLVLVFVISWSVQAYGQSEKTMVLTIDKANPKLQNLIFDALEHAIGSIKDSGGPLIPFVLSETDGKRSINRFASGETQQDLDSAFAFLRTIDPKPEFAVVVYDGYLTRSGSRMDAVIAKAYDRSAVVSFVCGQEYEPTSASRPFQVIGKPTFVGNDKNLLAQ